MNTTTLTTINPIVTTGVRRVPISSLSGNTGRRRRLHRATGPLPASTRASGALVGPRRPALGARRVLDLVVVIGARAARRQQQAAPGEQPLLVDVLAAA